MTKIAFLPQIAYTDKGNPYERSDVCQIAGIGAGIGEAAFYGRAHMKEISDEFKKSNTNTKKANIIFVALLMAAIFLGNWVLGIATDNYINKKKEEKADEDAEQQLFEQIENENDGL